MHPDHRLHVEDSEDALVASIYLASVVSLSDAECRTKLRQSKTSLLPQYQTSCEEALARTNILCTKNIVALKAMAIYLVGLSARQRTSWLTVVLDGKSGSFEHSKLMGSDGARHSQW